MDKAHQAEARKRLEAASPGDWCYIGDVIVGVVASCACPPDEVPPSAGGEPGGLYVAADHPHEAHDLVPPLMENDMPTGLTFEQWQKNCRFFAFAKADLAAALDGLREAEAANVRLREALSWAVGFIRCNYPKGADHDDFKNAEHLAKGGSFMGGPYHLACIGRELAEEDVERLARERDAARLNLGNILARIFGDGGHRQDVIGDDAAAVEEADGIVVKLRQEAGS